MLVVFGLVYVPIPPPAERYLVRKSPGNGVELPNESLAIVPLNVTLVRLVQLTNALSPIDVTLLGMVMLVRLVQPKNAPPPIDVTPAGMVTLPLIPCGTCTIAVFALLYSIPPSLA